MDVPLPTDRICKAKFFGGIVISLAFFGYVAFSWTSYSTFRHEVEKKKGRVKADIQLCTARLSCWREASEMRQQLYDDIERKKSIKTDPLTDDEKTSLRNKLTKLGSEPGTKIADPENVIATIDLMRTIGRNPLTVEQLQMQVKDVERILFLYESKSKDIEEFGNGLDRLQNEITADESKLTFDFWFDFFATSICCVVTFFCYRLSKSGLKEWKALEKAELEQKQSLKIAS